MKSFRFLLLSVALVAACQRHPPVYRAYVKLLVSYAADNAVHPDNAQFVLTQTDIVLSSMMLKRVEKHLQKTPEEVRDNLSNLKVAPLPNTDIIVVAVDSPSADFAKDFANALTEEYLKFRNEQRAATSEEALQPLIREVHDLSEQMKVINEKIVAFDKEHNVSTNPELSEQKALYEDRDRAQRIYNVSLAKLMKMDEARSLKIPTVSILESAVVEQVPVHRLFR